MLGDKAGLEAGVPVHPKALDGDEALCSVSERLRHNWGNYFFMGLALCAGALSC